jgi:hypothetical protein
LCKLAENSAEPLKALHAEPVAAQIKFAQCAEVQYMGKENTELLFDSVVREG